MFRSFVMTGYRTIRPVARYVGNRLQQSRFHRTAIPLVSLSLLVSLSVFFSTDSAMGEGERERIRFIVSTHLNLTDLSPANQPELSSIAFAGQNIGGVTQNASQMPLRQHVVTAGETLSGIAAQYNLHSGSIVLSNSSLEDTEVIHAGQVLTIPHQDASEEELKEEWKRRQDQISAKVAQAAKTKKATSKRALSSTSSVSEKLRTPIGYRYISQGYSGGHTGLDLVADIGTPVRATGNGCIIHQATGWNGGYGTVVIQDLGGGKTALYAHLSKFAGYSVGDCIEAGTTIAYSGNSGRSTGPHLHFEIRVSSRAVDPGKYIFN